MTVALAILAGETKPNIVWCLQQMTAAGESDPDSAFLDWWDSDMAHFLDRGPGMNATHELDLDHAPMYVLVWMDGLMD